MQSHGSLEIDAVVVLIKHIAIVAVGGELQHIRSTPVTGIATAQLQRNSVMVWSTVGFFPARRPRQMPLSDVGRLITGILFHVLAQRLDLGGQHQVVAEAAGLGGVFTGLEQGAAGPHTGWGEKALSNFTPSRASRSRFGVMSSGWPKQPQVSQRC